MIVLKRISPLSLRISASWITLLRNEKHFSCQSQMLTSRSLLLGSTDVTCHSFGIAKMWEDVDCGPVIDSDCNIRHARGSVQCRRAF